MSMVARKPNSADAHTLTVAIAVLRSHRANARLIAALEEMLQNIDPYAQSYLEGKDQSVPGRVTP